MSESQNNPRANGAAPAPALQPPALLASGGVLSLRVDTMPDGAKVAVLRAQSPVVGVDCPCTGENVDALIDALRQIRGQLGAGLTIAGPLDLPGGVNGRH